MSDNSSSFIIKSTAKASDIEHRRKINFNIARYNAVVPVGKQQFTQLESAREKAKNTKWRAIETLDKQFRHRFFSTLKELRRLVSSPAFDATPSCLHLTIGNQ